MGLVIATREGEEQETGEEGLEDMHRGDSARLLSLGWRGPSLASTRNEAEPKPLLSPL